MALLSLRNLRLAFGGPALLDGANLQVERGERICLVGRNGTGKSTLLRLIHGELEPDSGAVVREQGLRTSLLPQEVPLALAGTVYEVVASGHPLADPPPAGIPAPPRDPGTGKHPPAALRSSPSPRRTEEVRRRVLTVLSRMGLREEDACAELSAGMKRRVTLARALVSDPDILLLDEPTNHLDIEAITWMEAFLLRSAVTLLFVTHDRAFLRRLATRIVELDRGRLVSFPGDYEKYLALREEALRNESARDGEFDRRLEREEAWLRKGVRARRTRNEGRVRALLEMREAVRRRRTAPGDARMRLQEAERSGRLVLHADDISFAWEGKAPVVGGLSFTLMRGDRVGIIGPNGCGKTTLLGLLLGKIQPDRGSVSLGIRLQVAFFDQLRAQLDDRRTLQENVTDGADTVYVNGKPRHIAGYLADFLFSPAQLRSPIHALSGGERNRLLLARLFARPANVLVLDEPTNDLDPDTLDLLESLLAAYTGTVLLVSHDRAFLDNVVTSTLVFEAPGRVTEYVGGYDDWVRQRSGENEARTRAVPRARQEKPRPRTPPAGRRKITFRERQELEGLPDRIQEMENRRGGLHETLADPALYKEGDGKAVARRKAELEALERELAAAYVRWEELEGLSRQQGG